MDFLIQYGMFLAKVLTVAIAIIFVLVVVASTGNRHRREVTKGHVKVTKVNDHLDEMTQAVEKAVLEKETYKKQAKEKKKQEKKAHKARKAETDKAADAENQPRVFLLSFKGDIAAHEVASLRETITAILAVARPADEVILRLESPGGMVHAYGLASSQLMRIKDKKIPLTICVDKVAASGGYMMACIADRLVAAPFAIIGSIGVLVQLPNFHRVLKKNDIDYETIAAGEFKTTLTTFGEITQKGRDKVKADVEDMHGLFKSWVKDHRPSVDIDKISTGETWVGIQAKERYMVDELRTSDECIIEACKKASVYEVEYQQKQSIQEKVGSIFKNSMESVLSSIFDRAENEKFFK